jgi:polysaccharide export outer membrane protein
LQQDLQLRDGDSIYIPATTAVNLEESRQLSAANFAARNNRPLKVAVVGEVYRPGPYTLLEGAVGQPNQLINPNLLQVPSVTRAIQIAGGITQMADIRNVQVRRLTRSGPPQIIKLDFWKLLKTGDVVQDLPLQDGDTVEIPTATNISDNELTALGSASFSPDRITVNIVGEVRTPGQVSILPNSTLNQAILAAGGLVNNRAKRTVTLIRLNPNGTVEKRDIGTDFAQGVSQQNNPALRNNDIIIVKRNGLAMFSDGLNAVATPLGSIFGIFRLFGLGL